MAARVIDSDGAVIGFSNGAQYLALATAAAHYPISRQ